MNTKEYQILHHPVIRHNGKPQVGRIDVIHRDKGFPLSKLGSYVGYHYVIEENGQLVQCRRLDEIGAHTVNCGDDCTLDKSGAKYGTLNWRGIGICFAGDFRYDTLTSAQRKTGHELVYGLMYAFNMPISRVLLHRETKGTSCPVIDIRESLVREHRDFLNRRLYTQQSALLRVPPGARRTRIERAIAAIMGQLLPLPPL